MLPSQRPSDRTEPSALNGIQSHTSGKPSSELTVHRYPDTAAVSTLPLRSYPILRGPSSHRAGRLSFDHQAYEPAPANHAERDTDPPLPARQIRIDGCAEYP